MMTVDVAVDCHRALSFSFLQLNEIMSLQDVQQDTVCSLGMSNLDATFNIFPVTSHVTADDVVFHFRLMSMSVLLDVFAFFFLGWFCRFLGCLFYFVWFGLFCNYYFHQSAFKVTRSCLILTPF